MNDQRRFKLGWNVFIILAGIALIFLTFSNFKFGDMNASALFISLLILAFFAEYVQKHKKEGIFKN